MKKGKFIDKGKEILGSKKPAGINDFLSESDDNTDIRNDVKTDSSKYDSEENRIVEKNEELKESITIREEFRFPTELSEELRAFAFYNRTTKTAVVIEALIGYFRKMSKKKR